MSKRNTKELDAKLSDSSSEEEEQKYADECKQSFKEAMKEADSVEPEKVSDMLKRTFEVPTPDIKEQIKKYEEKESK